MPQSRLAAVGAFVIGGLALFAVGLFLIGDRRLLFADHFFVHAEFANISGLQNGARVRVAGMGAGEVDRIEVPPGPAARFRVRMRIIDDLRPLIRVDSVATIQTDGLVGNRIVQIGAGSEDAAPIEDEGLIRSREPFDFADLLESMSATIALVNTTVEELTADVKEALQAVTETAAAAEALVEDVGDDVRAIADAGRRLSDDVTALVAGVRRGEGTVGRLVTDDALYETARRIGLEAERAVTTIRQASDDARAALADFRAEEGPMHGVTGELQQTVAQAREAMTNLAQTTDALMRNFLVRGFFQRRGYFNLDDVTVQEYRRGALETRDRRALRIWLDAAVLFEVDAEGHERLTDGGRARLDSAMSHFVKYPPDSPFVVEGYAQGPTRDARFLLSRHRARIVRDYVVGRFGLDPVHVTIMEMGQEAEGSPAGDRWNGVALAMFVPASAT